MKKIIIYDFDGVLVNSRGAIYKYYDAIFERFSLPLIDWENSLMGKQAFGMTHVQLLSQYASGDELAEMVNYVPEFSREQLIEMSPLEKGAQESIPQLADSYHLAICTNRSTPPRDYLSHYRLESYFRHIITAADVRHAKPSPEGVLKILDFFDAEPENAIFIGDSEVDYLAASDAGVKFIAFGNELFSSPVINDHREVIKFI